MYFASNKELFQKVVIKKIRTSILSSSAKLNSKKSNVNLLFKKLSLIYGALKLHIQVHIGYKYKIYDLVISNMIWFCLFMYIFHFIVALENHF